MSYLVLARKWRPQVFEDLIGQEHVTRTLQNAIQLGRVAHAFLFAGARGVGKTSAARILAKCLNCQQGPAPAPCNECAPCTEITEGRSVDIFEIDGASNTGVDDVRTLRENVKYLPSSARQKVYIIDEVHMLSKNAFNALLKTLEEPPPHITFIFATTEPHMIPATILSRCQRYDFKRIPLPLIMERIKRIAASEGVTLGDDAAVIIGRAAGGSMRDAESLFDQVISYCGEEIQAEAVRQILGVMDRRSLFDTTRAILAGEPERCLRIMEEIHEAGYDLKQFARELLAFFRDLAVIKVAPNTEGLVDLPEAELAEAKEIAESCSDEEIQNLFTVFCRAEEEVLRSRHPRIILEMSMVKMARMTPLAPVGDLIERLMAMERRVDTPEAAGRPVPRAPAPGPPPARSDSAGPASEPVESTAAPTPKESPTPKEPATSEEPPPPEGSPPAVGPQAQAAPGEGTGGGAEEDLRRRLLARAKEESRPLVSVLELAEKFSLGDNELRVVFSQQIYIDMLQDDEEKCKLFRRICREVIDPNISIKIENSKPVPDRAAEAGGKAAGGKSPDERSIRLEALNSPIVQEALDIFEADVIEVRPIKKQEA